MRFKSRKIFGRYAGRSTPLALVTGSMIWLMHKFYTTHRSLTEAIDLSIIELHEPNKEGKLSLCKSQHWILPNYDIAMDVIHRFAAFFKFMYARRLLNVAQCENPHLRLLAVERLATIQLENWQCSLLAHMCDARTAVGIARTKDYNPAFFLPPPRIYGMYNNQVLIHNMKDYLNFLYQLHEPGHICLRRTATHLFLEPQDTSRLVDQYQGFEDVIQRNKDVSYIITLSLKTIRHHSMNPNYSADIIHGRGLCLLMELYHRFNHDTNICIELVNIIANISRQEMYLEDFFKTGWIAVLGKWANNTDLRLAGPAVQALKNFDGDAFEPTSLTPKMYLLHPRFRSTEEILVDVIFVHGLLGHVFHTWRSSKSSDETINLSGKPPPHSNNDKQASIGLDQQSLQRMQESSDPAAQEYATEMADEIESEWNTLGDDYEFVLTDIPTDADTEEDVFTLQESKKNDEQHKPTQCWGQDWLPQDCPHIRVFGLNYNTSLSEWANVCPETSSRVSLSERSHELLHTIKDAGIGKRPIVWVTHSMGGLVVKGALAAALQSEDEELRKICKQSKLLVFYSTPHFGSKLATLNTINEYLVMPTMDVQELRQNSPNLLRIHSEFMEMLKSVPIKVISFIEKKATLVTSLKINFTLVESESAKLDVGEWYEVEQSHLSICKPANKESFLYQKVLQEIQKLVTEQKNRPKMVW